MKEFLSFVVLPSKKVLLLTLKNNFSVKQKKQ